MQNVTVIIVSYNTADLLQEAHYSVRKYYPDIPVIIVDNSEPGTNCYAIARLMESENTMIHQTKKNIGHGPAMCIGIELCKTTHFLLMDSDVTINCSGVIERLMKLFKHYTYGVGKVIQVNEEGGNVERSGIPYLHPHFALINKYAYDRCEPIINHGAPMIRAMKSISKHGYSLAWAEWGDNVTHHERGTRKLNPVDFNPANWDKA